MSFIKPDKDMMPLSQIPFRYTPEEKSVLSGTISNGNTTWFKNGLKHRDDDLPAIEWLNGTREWYKNGLRHRDTDNPSVIWSYGTIEWYKNGKRHRDNDMPAVIHADGSKEWYTNGLCHRDGDFPAIVWADRTELYYKQGKIHRSGNKYAVIVPKHNMYEWWIDGTQYRFPIYFIRLGLATLKRCCFWKK